MTPLDVENMLLNVLVSNSAVGDTDIYISVHKLWNYLRVDIRCTKHYVIFKCHLIIIILNFNSIFVIDLFCFLFIYFSFHIYDAYNIFSFY